MLYIACEEMDFIWTETEVSIVERMWREGYDIRVIARDVKRDIDEVALLVMDRARRKRIRLRKTGIFGVGCT